MNIKKFNKKGLKKFEFVNVCGGTRSGFYHEATLFENGIKLIKNRCNYLNRTWEAYTFQTVMLGAVYQLIEDKKEILKNQFKNENNIKRLTGAKAKELEKIIKNDKRIKELLKLQKELRGSNW